MIKYKKLNVQSSIVYQNLWLLCKADFEGSLVGNHQQKCPSTSGVSY